MMLLKQNIFKISLVFFFLVSAACSRDENPAKMEFKLVKADTITPGWIAAEGEIVEETPADFETFLSSICATEKICDLKSAKISTIGFESNGGDLLASIELGRIIRSKTLNTAPAKLVLPQSEITAAKISFLPSEITWEGGNCESACAYAYIGGISRQGALFNKGLIEGRENKKGIIGVHQFYRGHAIKIGDESNSISEPATLSTELNETASAQRYSAIITSYLEDMGVLASLFHEATTATPTDMRYFDANDDTSFRTRLMTHDILWWSAEDGAPHLWGRQSLDDYSNDARLRVSCHLDNINKRYLQFTLYYFSDSIFGPSQKNWRDVEFYKPNAREYNGISVSFNGKTILSQNGDAASPTHNKASATFRIDHDEMGEILRNLGGFLSVEFVGGQFSSYPERNPVAIFLDREFYSLFERTFGTSQSCYRIRGGGRASNALGSTDPSAAPSDGKTDPSGKNLNNNLTDLSGFEALGMDRVFFDEGSSVLTESAKSTLSKLAIWLHARPTVNILLKGHTSYSDGHADTRNETLALSAERHRAVKEYLESSEIHASRISTAAYGRERPYVRGDTADAIAQNRTVRIVLRQ